MTVVSPEELQPGNLLAGRFRLLRTLGRGAMGTVWLARDEHLDEEAVACKFLSGTLVRDRQAISSLKREVLLARRLRHPHIIAVHTFWDVDGLNFITMEYVDGTDLAHALNERDGPFPIHEVLPWVRNLCNALDFAHDQGVLHRDLKPANFLLGSDGLVRLADFGIARTMSDLQQRFSGGTTCGTVMFMSPEQLMGDPVDRRSDLYSMAASVYEMLAGLPPFHKGAIVAQVQWKPAPPIAHLSEAVNRVLLKALSKKPEDRQASCGAFANELEEAATIGQGTKTDERKRDALPVGVRTGAVKSSQATTVRLNTLNGPGGLDRLGALLVEAGAITPEELDGALEAQERTGERLGRILIRMGCTDEVAMALALERQLRIPFVPLEHEHFDPKIVRIVSQEFAREHKCVPVRQVGDMILLTMADPLDFDTINAIEAICGQQVIMRIATESDILSAVERECGNG